MDFERMLREGADRLRRKGVFGQAGDLVSIRIPGKPAFLTAEIDVSGTLEISQYPIPSPRGSAQPLSEATPAPAGSGARSSAAPDSSGLYSPFLQAHGEVYLHRPDVGAVLTSRPPWSQRLHSLPDMPAIFDEQVRQLGDGMTRLFIGGGAFSEPALRLLAQGGNSHLIEEAVLCLGYTLDRLAFNSELLEKCAKSYVLASLSGEPIGRIPWLVRYIAGGRLKKDERKAAEAYASGHLPTGLGGY